jgi:hypothetical protein
MADASVKRWQVIGGKQPGQGGVCFYGTDAAGKPKVYRGGDIFFATDAEVAAQRHKVVEAECQTPYVAPRDKDTARVANQDEAQRRRRLKLDRQIKEAPHNTAM